jgi:hypothetical protein
LEPLHSGRQLLLIGLLPLFPKIQWKSSLTAGFVVSVTGKNCTATSGQLKTTTSIHFQKHQNLKAAHEVDGKTPYRVTRDALEESQFGRGANGRSCPELDIQTLFRSTKDSPKSADFLGSWSSF